MILLANIFSYGIPNSLATGSMSDRKPPLTKYTGILFRCRVAIKFLKFHLTYSFNLVLENNFVHWSRDSKCINLDYQNTYIFLFLC